MVNTIQKKEQIIRKVTPIGNGAHIFAPRGWLNQEVIVIRVPKPTLKEEILDILNPYLEGIIGVYLYGSYARNEQNKNSDIDLLIISDKKMKIKKENFEIIVLEEKSLNNAVKISPILMLSALFEAKAIINSKLLKKLRGKYKLQKKHIKEYLKQTKEFIVINEEFPSLYSLVLRLRGIYILNQILSNKKYSKKDFIKWVLKYASKINSKKIENYKQDSLLNEKEVDSLISTLKKRVKELEIKNGKKKKKT